MSTALATLTIDDCNTMIIEASGIIRFIATGLVLKIKGDDMKGTCLLEVAAEQCDQLAAKLRAAARQ